MADNLPARATSVLEPLTAADGGGFAERARAFTAQPAIRKSLPMVAGLGAVALAGALYLSMASGPQRILYASLSDSERAEVASALDKGGISYTIDNDTGALSVSEDELYRARMLVASTGSLAAPETTAQMLDAIPIGSSRTLEGERLRNVRERELTMTIMEIDGVEAVRVHLAQAERSVFVRESSPPTASVMVRLARGRNLTDDQVRAIVNLVAGSVPGMNADNVRVVDQHGQLLSDRSATGGERLELQREYEEKMRAQIAQLLVPMLGEGNFSSEVQVELDLDEVTKARESYDKDGVIRSETSRETSQSGGGTAGGIPGVLSNTPPPPTTLGNPAANSATPATTGESSGEKTAQRTYELGREVAVSSTSPGGIKRLTVAVALSSEALKKIKPASAKQVEQLVASAVGANPARGDAVTVIAGTFEPVELAEAPFYETPWFATILRNAVALIAVILALIFGVRPLVRALKPDKGSGADDATSPEGASPELQEIGDHTANGPVDTATLHEQVGLAKKLAAEQPDRAVEALRRMLAAPAQGTGA